MKTHNPEINQTNNCADEQSDQLFFMLRVALTANVAPERIATLIGEIESGQQPDLYAAQKKYRKEVEDNCVKQLKAIDNVTRPLIAALERKDLTNSELLFLHNTLGKYSAGRAKVLALAENLYQPPKKG